MSKYWIENASRVPENFEVYAFHVDENQNVVTEGPFDGKAIYIWLQGQIALYDFVKSLARSAAEVDGKS